MKLAPGIRLAAQITLVAVVILGVALALHGMHDLSTRLTGPTP